MAFKNGRVLENWLGCAGADTVVEVGRLCKRSHCRQLQWICLSKQEISGFWDEWRWRGTKDSCGWSWGYCMTQGWEQRWLTRRTWDDSKVEGIASTFAARFQQPFLLPSSTSVVTPRCYISLRGPLTEMAVHLWGRFRPSLEATVLEQTFLWLQIPTEQPLADILPSPGKKWWRAADKGKRGTFLLSLLLVLFKLYLSVA